MNDQKMYECFYRREGDYGMASVETLRSSPCYAINYVMVLRPPWGKRIDTTKVMDMFDCSILKEDEQGVYITRPEVWPHQDNAWQELFPGCAVHIHVRVSDLPGTNMTIDPTNASLLKKE